MTCDQHYGLFGTPILSLCQDWVSQSVKSLEMTFLHPPALRWQIRRIDRNGPLIFQHWVQQVGGIKNPFFLNPFGVSCFTRFVSQLLVVLPC